MKAADFFDDSLITEVNRAMWPFRSQIADREQVRVALALSRQKRIAAANARIDRVFVEGLGEVVASIDPDIYHRFGLMYGYETVNSPDFLKSLLRDNPDLRVKSRSRKSGIYLTGHYRDEAEPVTLDAETEAAEIEEGALPA